VLGALAIAPSAGEPALEVVGVPAPPVGPLYERAIPTGFEALDAVLGLGGLPRAAATAICGDGTSGKTTLALRAMAQAQAAGGIVAYLDLVRSLDPVEAAARGVALDWLVVLTPASLAEALAMAAMLLQDRTVDLILLDLPARPVREGLSEAVLGERLNRLVAMARRAGVQILVLEPPGLPSALSGVLAQVAALRLELSRRAWIRLGREVVGQRTEARVTRDRFGPPGRAAELRILYADGGPRDACLVRDELLRETAPGIGRASRVLGRAAPPGVSRPAAAPSANRPMPPPRPTRPVPFIRPIPVSADATSPSLLAPSAPPPGLCPVVRAVPGGADRAGRQAVVGRAGAGREQVGAGIGGPARDAARSGPPARS
jgi:RecA/RadA recombinase